MTTTPEQLVATTSNEKPTVGNNSTNVDEIGRRIEPTQTVIPDLKSEENNKEANKTTEQKEKEKSELDFKIRMAEAEKKELERARAAATAKIRQIFMELISGKNADHAIETALKLIGIIIDLNTSKSPEEVQIKLKGYEDDATKLAKMDNIAVPSLGVNTEEKPDQQPAGTNSPVTEGMATGNMTETAMPSVTSAPETNGVTEVTIDEGK